VFFAGADKQDWPVIFRYLDTAQSGPMFLRQEEIASFVLASLHRGVIMANHVHGLLFPLVPPSRLLQSLKGATAREANRVLGRTGEPFWQRESYDHWVRDEREWTQIAAYIENNPVKAGLVSRAEDYRWSSAQGSRDESRDGTQECVRHNIGTY